LLLGPAQPGWQSVNALNSFLGAKVNSESHADSFCILSS
jgi:hypothetical protein